MTTRSERIALLRDALLPPLLEYLIALNEGHPLDGRVALGEDGHLSIRSEDVPAIAEKVASQRHRTRSADEDSTRLDRTLVVSGRDEIDRLWVVAEAYLRLLTTDLRPNDAG